MNRYLCYAVSGLKSALFVSALGCLLVAGLAGAFFQPTAAARVAAKPFSLPLHEALSPPATEPQNPIQLTPQENVSVLELRDGKLRCRPATEEEASAMAQPHRDAELHVISDEAPSLSAAEPAQPGMRIIMRGTAQLEQQPEAKAAFLRAARVWESLIQNRITIIIDVDYGPTNFGRPFGNFGGVSNSTRFLSIDYSLIRERLLSSASSPQDAAFYRSLPTEQLPTDLGAVAKVSSNSTPLRALGLLPPVADHAAEQEKYGTPLLIRIGFNSAYKFDFDPSDGIRTKHDNFTALALHEIGHALGFTTSVGDKELNPNNPLRLEMMDWFRFRPGVTAETFGSAPRILSSGGEHVFFDGERELPLSTGRMDGSGGDGDQACHWKDDFLTKRYLGIMDPSGADSVERSEITENDLRVFNLIGYHTNPLPNARQAELKLDDGNLDRALPFDGLMIVNRLTPPSYPATLRKLRVTIPRFATQPDPTGKPITLLVYASGDGQLPPNAPFTRVAADVPTADSQNFLEFTIPNGPTINSGDFYVGYQLPSPHQGAGFAIDLSGEGENRSFFSTDNGASFAPLADVTKTHANAMIRALVSVGDSTPIPTPTPTPTPGPDTIALTSGARQNSWMSVGSFFGALYKTQYTIEVPAGAAQLKIDLSGDKDVDFYVNFNRRVTAAKDENGFLIADFKSVSDSNNEALTITPASSPALQPGKYYIAVVNYGPGPVNFTVMATVTGGDPPKARAVRVTDGALERMNRAVISVELDAQGDERELGFSLTFNPMQLRFVSAAPGQDAAGATFNINTYQAVSGRLGFAIAMPAGKTFAAGQRQIVKLTFTRAANSNAAVTAVEFADQPVTREVSDSNARALPASFIGGKVTLNQSAPRLIAR